jgi:carbamoyl-phosphate synthase large subunit
MILQLKRAMQRNLALSGGKLIVASSDALTPAGYFADASEHVPLIKSPDYVEHLLDVCRKHNVRVVIPLIDLDLERLAPQLDAFTAIGTTVICPPPDLVDLCFDKGRFAEFCLANALEHAPFYAAATLDDAHFPLFYKRRRGFGSIGSGICQSHSQAEQLLRDAPDTLFQALIRATEVSVDAYISRQGECVVCVPRSRDKVVAGEAYKTRTVAMGPVSRLARQTVDALARAGLRGPLNVQVFDTDPPSLIEVNTRLGSASVLSNMAVNGRLFEAVLAEGCGETVTGDPADYAVGLSLTRFLGDVFHRDRDVTAVFPS